MIPELAIAGHRQAGKTTALIRLAVMEACAGEDVLFQSYNGEMAKNHFHDTVDWLTQNPMFHEQVRKIRRANGNQQIEFRSGGTLRFPPPSKTGYRSYRPDVQVIDDDMGAEPHPHARRVYRGLFADE